MFFFLIVVNECKLAETELHIYIVEMEEIEIEMLNYLSLSLWKRYLFYLVLKGAGFEHLHVVAFFFLDRIHPDFQLDIQMLIDLSK